MVAFTIADLEDLKRLLIERPEWRAELRPLILGEEVMALPEVVRRLAEAQERTERRLDDLAREVSLLSAQVSQLSVQVSELSAQVSQLSVQISQLSADMRELVAVVNKEAIRIDRLDGAYTEWVFVRKAEAYFGTWLTRTMVVSLADVGVYDAEDSGALTSDEVVQLTNVDILVRGRDKAVSGRPETVLAVEVSSTVDYEDVDGARDRAALLGKTGLRARAAVAGHDISSGAQRFADEHSVLVKIVPPSESPR